jgi:hypothetical protein
MGSRPSAGLYCGLSLHKFRDSKSTHWTHHGLQLGLLWNVGAWSPHVHLLLSPLLEKWGNPESLPKTKPPQVSSGMLNGHPHMIVDIWTQSHPLIQPHCPGAHLGTVSIPTLRRQKFVETQFLLQNCKFDLLQVIKSLTASLVSPLASSGSTYHLLSRMSQGVIPMHTYILCEIWGLVSLIANVLTRDGAIKSSRGIKNEKYTRCGCECLHSQ